MYRNFILKLDWDVSQKAKKSYSGIFVRFPYPDNDPMIAVYIYATSSNTRVFIKQCFWLANLLLLSQRKVYTEHQSLDSYLQIALL
jgi:hypothetical protein